MEKRKFANVCIDLMAEITSPCEEWALKSQSAALVAEVWLFWNCRVLICYSQCNRVDNSEWVSVYRFFFIMIW